MNITQDNCTEYLECFAKDAEECEFYAMDQEMTGIRFEPLRKFKDGSELYSSVSEVGRTFIPFQLGICFFKRSEPTKGNLDFAKGLSYEARPYTFWLRYRVTEEELGSMKDRITLSTTAIDFLLNHKMDFQFWLQKGIHFGHQEPQQAKDAFDQLVTGVHVPLRKDEEDCFHLLFNAIRLWYDAILCPRSMEQVTKEIKENKAFRVVSAKENELFFLLEKNITTFVEKLLKATLYINTPPLLPTYTCTDEEAAEKEINNLPKGDKSLRNKFKTIPVNDLQQLKKFAFTNQPAFPFLIERRGSNGLLVSTISSKLLATLVADNARKREKAISTSRGFLPYLDALLAAKRPIVAHNSFTDFVFFYQAHIGQLPASYPSFKTALTMTFPAGVYDTKFIATLHNQRMLSEDAYQNNSIGSLGDLYRRCCERVFKQAVAAGPNGASIARFRIPNEFRFESSITGCSNNNSKVNFISPDADCGAAHNAAYDAYMTGVVLVLFSHLLNSSDLLEMTKNKITQFSMNDYCIALDGQDYSLP